MKRTILCLGLIQLLLVPLARADCNQAQELVQQAKSLQSSAAKIPLLEEASRICDWFDAHYELGKAYAKTGRLEESGSAFNKAFHAAKKDENKALALQALARLHRYQGHREKALVCYKNSLRLNPKPAVEQEMMELDLQTQGRITTAKALKESMQACKAVGVVPSIDVRVNFAFDSSALTEKGRSQADEMGKALKRLGDFEVVLIGHTDSRGSSAYNDRLSLERAKAVRDYLVGRQAIDPGWLRIQGKGEREPLYQGNAPQTHRLNRRVEVLFCQGGQP